MALRQVDIHIPESYAEMPALEEEFDILSRWDFQTVEDQRFIRLLVETKNADALVDWLNNNLADADDYRVVITSVEATIPRPGDGDSEEAEVDIDTPEESEKKDDKSVTHISREEVYQDVQDSISTSPVFYTLVVLSTIVAAGGMIGDSTAVVIGAMVIAPLIGPNIALALGTTLADGALLKRAAKVNFVGVGLGLAVSVGVGLVVPFDPLVSEIAGRMEVGVGDVALALAAGAAGVLSVTRGVSAALIGVMVAVALLPPLVAFGLMVGIGEWSAAYGAGLLTITNLAAINLAGIITFVVQGIRPSTWYEEEKAKRLRFVATAIWIAVLGLLITAILIGDPSAVGI